LYIILSRGRAARRHRSLNHEAGDAIAARLAPRIVTP
jgi:hypothetical protein